MSKSVEHSKIPDTIVEIVGKTPIVQMLGERIIVAKKKGRFNVLKQAPASPTEPTKSTAVSSSSSSSSSSLSSSSSSSSEVGRNIELNQHTWSDISQLSDPSAFLETIGGEEAEETKPTDVHLISNLESLFQPLPQSRQRQPQPNLASLFQPLQPEPKYLERKVENDMNNMSPSLSSFRRNNDVPIHLVGREHGSLQQGNKTGQRSPILLPKKQTFNSSSSPIAAVDNDDLSEASLGGENGMEKILNCLDQMKLEVTNSDHIMKKLQKELKMLKQVNSNLEKKNANLQIMYDEQYKLREAAEMDLKWERTKQQRLGLGIINSNDIVGNSNNSCSDSQFLKSTTTATEPSLSPSKIDFGIITGEGYIGDSQQVGLSTSSVQTSSSRDGEAKVMTGHCKSLMSRSECCSHSTSSITVISQEDFVSAAKKMLHKTKKKRKKNKSDIKHNTTSHKKSPPQHINQQEDKKNSSKSLNQIMEWNSLSVGSIITKETRSILSSDFSSCDDVVSSEEDDVLTALSGSKAPSSSNHQSLSSSSSRRIKTKQQHQIKSNNNKSSSRFRILGPTLDSTTNIENANIIRT